MIDGFLFLACACNAFGPVGALIFLVTGIFLAFLLVLGWMLADMLPDKVRPGDPPRNRCRRCGYNLRASPDYCPECGTAREIVRKHGQTSHELAQIRHITFRSQPRGDQLLVVLPLGLTSLIDRILPRCPGDADLLFATMRCEGERLTSADDLLRAATTVLDVARGDLTLRDLLIPLRRVRQFARDNAYARITRTVSG